MFDRSFLREGSQDLKSSAGSVHVRKPPSPPAAVISGEVLPSAIGLVQNHEVQGHSQQFGALPAFLVLYVYSQRMCHSKKIPRKIDVADTMKRGDGQLCSPNQGRTNSEQVAEAPVFDPIMGNGQGGTSGGPLAKWYACLDGLDRRPGQRSRCEHRQGR